MKNLSESKYVDGDKLKDFHLSHSIPKGSLFAGSLNEMVKKDNIGQLFGQPKSSPQSTGCRYNNAQIDKLFNSLQNFILKYQAAY